MKKIVILLGLVWLALILVFFLVPQKSNHKSIINDSKSDTISILAVGDIMLSREVAARINKNNPDYPFDNTSKLTTNADLTIGNLESPFTYGKSDTNQNSMVFGAELKSVEGLKNAGFDGVNLANNHFSNQGIDGMNLTFDTLNNNGIGYFGAGRNFTEAHTPLIKNIDNVKIALLGYTDKDVLPANSIATDSTPGVAEMDVNQVKLDIAEAKTKADIIIISMHSGYEYTPYANSRQIEFAHTAIDNGADIVIGHHPHVVQATETYKGKTIIYSLGNFVFDQPWSVETQQGIIAKIKFENNNLTKMELIPFHIYDWSQPSILINDELEYRSILNRIQAASKKLI